MAGGGFGGGVGSSGKCMHRILLFPLGFSGLPSPPATGADPDDLGASPSSLLGSLGGDGVRDGDMERRLGAVMERIGLATNDSPGAALEVHWLTVGGPLVR